jgi:hypothetical protein
MASPRFLFDADVPGPLTQALRQHQPTMDILCSGEPGAPPRRTPDPLVLLAAENMQRLLLTGDRSTMTGHLQDHYDAGHHTWGVLLMRNRFPLKAFYQEIVLIWTASEADEWRDVMLYIP